jgi:hypothetical protein
LALARTRSRGSWTIAMLSLMRATRCNVGFRPRMPSPKVRPTVRLAQLHSRSPVGQEAQLIAKVALK